MRSSCQSSSPPETSSVPDPSVLNFEGTGEAGICMPMLQNGRESLAVSLEQVKLKKFLFDLKKKLLFEPVNAPFWVISLANGLFPIIIEESAPEFDQQQKQDFELTLRMAFEESPVEDGINHAAEHVLDEMLRSQDQQPILELLGKIAVDDGRPYLASSILRCLGRRRPGTAYWRAEIVREALTSDDLEIRDAAVQAAESWGGLEIRRALQDHKESISWLRAYVDEVVEDLNE